MAKPVAGAPLPPPYFTSIFAATEEDDVGEADQPVADDLTPMDGITSTDLPAIDAGGPDQTHAPEVEPPEARCQS